MKLERLTLSGFSPAFPGVIDLPLGDLPPGVYAVVGENGAGKTTLLETVPGAIYRSMPSNDGADPVSYASTRESFLDLVYAFDGLGTFRSRLNLDGPKRQTDAVLEQLLPNGTHVPLNDGKRSTYDEAIKSRFPSFDVFVNSSFAAQGRGDEFTRRPPSKRKDLFVEFLVLAHLAEKAKNAAAAAELCEDSRLRLEVSLEQVSALAGPAIAEAMERDADTLQTDGGTAEIRKLELKALIADLEARLALLADQVAANTAAAERVRTHARELAGRQADRAAITRQRELAGVHMRTDQELVVVTRDDRVADADKRIAGNQQILGMQAAITAAVVTLATLDEQWGAARAEFTERQAELRQANDQLHQVEKQLAALVTVEDRAQRAERDAKILDTVPCSAEGEYASCQFLVNALAAEAQVRDLNQQLAPKAALAETAGRHAADVERLDAAVKVLQASTSALEAQRVEPAKLVKYSAPLAEATAKIASYEEAKTKALTDADTQLAAAQARHDARLAELQAQAVALDDQIARLTREHASAEADLAATVAGNTQAAVLQAQLASARVEWDTVTSTIARVVHGREDLARRRQAFDAARTKLVDMRQRAARIDQELVEWRDLAKMLGKGGLQDLEIDAAGPGISATANVLLRTCAGPRYTMELVTQVNKADGSGLKDDFTVRVIDNEKGGDWRDIKAYSGGQKTILQEALMCALALYVNERSPMPIRTLWRDETGAALDPDNAIRYVDMLRKVREIGGLHHVFFISHHPDAAARADAQIQVGGGQAVIVYPPYAEVA